jgi:signal transduction histidine kinase
MAIRLMVASSVGLDDRIRGCVRRRRGGPLTERGQAPVSLASEVWQHRGVSQPIAVADLLVGLAWIGAGLATSTRRRTRRSSMLMVGVGAAWLLGDLVRPLVLLHRGALAHLLLAYPSGRLGSAGARAVVAGFYLAAILAGSTAGPVWTLAFAVALPVAVLVRFMTASGAVRRGRAVPLVVAVGVGAVLAVGSVAELAGAVHVDVLEAYEVTLVLAALVFLVDLRAAQWSRAAITGLVIDLGRRPADGVVRERLARAVGDPSLAVGYVLGDGSAPVDEQGRSVALPAPETGRAVTPVRHEGRQVAVLIHDPAALGDRTVLEGAASALGVAVANARLQADVRASLAELEASTRRLIDTEDAQRRRLGSELRAQVDPLLEEAGQALFDARAEELDKRLRAVRDQLARFASGLDPVALHEGGLPLAVRVLASEAGLPVALSLPDLRYPFEVERCAWFVCSEAIANALKHAGASRLSIGVTPRDGKLRVEIVDDGTGGAEPARGSGLRRLAERVQAHGGLLTVESPPGHGTRLVAELDLEASA